MNISGLTAANISSTVWTQATRSLTNSGYETITGSANQAIAAATTVNFQPAAGKYRLVTVLAKQGAGATSSLFVELFDGTTAAALLALAANAIGSVNLILASNAVYVRVRNADASVAGLYAVTYIECTV